MQSRKLQAGILGAAFFAALVGLIVVLTAGSGEKGPFLPGITVTDDHPRGCVDCHRNAGEGQDYRLNVSLREIEDHPDITAIVKKIPDDCAMCHKEGTSAGPLSLALHKHHYEDPTENHFISFYKGSCLNCHTLDAETGKMGVKSGPKNW